MFTEAISELGVTATQLGLAVHIDELGHLSGSDLARHFAITPQSVSTALNGLEKLGWVKRTPHPVHKRVIWFEVTEFGRERARAGREILSRFDTMLKDRLGAESVADTTRQLLSITEEFIGPERLPTPLWPVR